MIINKVVIENFKSIDNIELDFDSVDKSYTKVFVGINESGKSNILEALSFLDVPERTVSYDQYCNQKNENNDDCNIEFHLDFNDDEDYNEFFFENVSSNLSFKFALNNLVKNVYLEKNSDSFECYYDYNIELPSSKIYIVKRNVVKNTSEWVIDDKFEENEEAELLTEKSFEEKFSDIIDIYIQKNEPKVSMWKASPDYLLSDVDLNVYKTDIESNKPLKNIFKLSGYVDNDSIVEAINKINISRCRSKLVGKLNASLNDYISKVWKCSIDIIMEITETGKFSLLIKDKGKENEHDRFSISERSQGAKHFLSLILSLSLETKNHERKNELILIDEPEVHLHPSGIRDLAKELLKIGKENYVFIATHSPFMIDKVHKERHFIVKKDKRAITEITRIRETDNIIDDEVLNDAFGINVYRDLLNPHSVLVEGASDKILLQKAFNILGRTDIGITNCHGSNIDTLASKMNFDNISVLIIVDDDKDGRKYKENILKIGGVYNEDNVFTIRDLIGDIVDQGTIEDTLDLEYVKSQFLNYYRSIYEEELTDVNFDRNKPVIVQIADILKKKQPNVKCSLDLLKKQISENYNPSKGTFQNDSNLLYKLAKKIIEKL